MAKNEGIPELKTETFTDVKSVIGSIIDYATSRVSSHWNQGKNWTTKILDGKRSKWRSTACSLSCVTCQITTDMYVLFMVSQSEFITYTASSSSEFMFDGLAHGLPRVILVLGFFREFSSQGIL